MIFLQYVPDLSLQFNIEVIFTLAFSVFFSGNRERLEFSNSVQYVYLEVLLLVGLVGLAQDEVVVDLLDERLVVVDAQLSKEGFPHLNLQQGHNKKKKSLSVLYSKMSQLAVKVIAGQPSLDLDKNIIGTIF